MKTHPENKIGRETGHPQEAKLSAKHLGSPVQKEVNANLTPSSAKDTNANRQ